MIVTAEAEVTQRIGQRVCQCTMDQAWITQQLILSLIYQLHIH
jgi:hypothetical protein